MCCLNPQYFVRTRWVRWAEMWGNDLLLNFCHVHDEVEISEILFRMPIKEKQRCMVYLLLLMLWPNIFSVMETFGVRLFHTLSSDFEYSTVVSSPQGHILVRSGGWLHVCPCFWCQDTQSVNSVSAESPSGNNSYTRTISNNLIDTRQRLGITYIYLLKPKLVYTAVISLLARFKKWSQPF